MVLNRNRFTQVLTDVQTLFPRLIEDLNNIPDDKNKGPVSKSPKKVKKYVPRSYEREVARESRRKSTGARQNRRNENSKLLLSLLWLHANNVTRYISYLFVFKDL